MNKYYHLIPISIISLVMFLGFNYLLIEKIDCSKQYSDGMIHACENQMVVGRYITQSFLVMPFLALLLLTFVKNDKQKVLEQ